MGKISVEGYSFHGLLEEGTMDIFHQLETIKYRYHVDAVSIWNGFFPTTDSAFLSKVAHGLKEREMVLANLAVDGANAWNDDPERREKNYRNALNYLAIAEKLGAKSVRIDWGVPREELTEEEEDLIVSHFREYSAIAANAGFRLLAENHAGAARNPHFMKRVYEKINHPAYGILLHVGSWYTDKDAGDEIVLPYAQHTHVTHRVVEERIDEVLALFSKYGYRGYIGVEQHGGKNEYETVGWQIARVRRALAEMEE